MKAKPPARSWLIIVVLAGLGVGYFALVFLPGRKATAEIHRQIATKRQFLAGTEQLGMALAATQADLIKTDEYVKSLGATIRPEGGQAKVLGQLHALASAAGVTTTRFEPEALVRKDALSQIPVNMAVTGRLQQILDLIYRIERLPTRIWVDQAKFAKINKGSEPGKDISVELNLVIFTDNSEDSDYVKLDQRPIN